MFGNDPDRPDVRPPRWATCGTCRWCDRSGEVFEMLDDALRDKLNKHLGLCVNVITIPLLVELDTPPADMACEGESWTLA